VGSQLWRNTSAVAAAEATKPTRSLPIYTRAEPTRDAASSQLTMARTESRLEKQLAPPVLSQREHDAADGTQVEAL
jgi:hypothetical protein